MRYNDLEIANHGLIHVPFSAYDKQKQDSMLKESTNKFKEILNVSPKLFIPPENRFNDDTKQVLIENGFTHLSASMYDDSPPFPLESDSLYRFPEIATTGVYVPSQNRILGVSSDRTFSDALDGINQYGFAVITMHPQEYSVFNGIYLNELNLDQFKELETLIEKIKSHNIDVVHLGQIDQSTTKVIISEKLKNPLDPFDIPTWVRNNAGWWRDGHIDDNTFVNGIQYLIKEGIMQIPPTTQGSGGSEIPDWVKINAGWWAEGKISDEQHQYYGF